jgi:hypothetical protein
MYTHKVVGSFLTAGERTYVSTPHSSTSIMYTHKVVGSFLTAGERTYVTFTVNAVLL